MLSSPSSQFKGWILNRHNCPQMPECHPLNWENPIILIWRGTAWSQEQNQFSVLWKEMTKEVVQWDSLSTWAALIYGKLGRWPWIPRPGLLPCVLLSFLVLTFLSQETELQISPTVPGPLLRLSWSFWFSGQSKTARSKCAGSGSDIAESRFHACPLPSARRKATLASKGTSGGKRTEQV